MIAGPLSGKTFPMNREEVSIGREPSNEISFLDSSVSRRHCLIRKEGEVFQIRDLESRNGTFVNGVPLKERTLEHTDQIQIGSSVLVFLTSDALARAPVPCSWMGQGRAAQLSYSGNKTPST